MNNNITALKLLSTSLLLSAGAVSLYLTSTFMFSLGKEMSQAMAITFVVVGIIFELFKSFSPTLLMKLAPRHQFLSIGIVLLSLSLVFMSGCASIFSLQAGVDDLLSNSKASQVALTKADIVRKEIDALQSLQQKQIEINHITAANKTSTQIAVKNDQLTSLIDQSVDASDSSLIGQFSTYIILTIAVGLELVIIILSCVNHALNNQNTNGLTQKHDETTPSQPLVSQGFAVSQPLISKQSQTAEALPEVVWQASTCKEQTLLNLATSIQSGAVEPKHRSVFQAFKGYIKQAEVGEYLAKLAEMNILKRLENGSYVLVTAD